MLMKFEAQKLSPQIKGIGPYRIHGTGTIVGIFTCTFTIEKINDSIHFRSVNIPIFIREWIRKSWEWIQSQGAPFEVPTILKSKEVNQKLVRFARKTDKTADFLAGEPT